MPNSNQTTPQADIQPLNDTTAVPFMPDSTSLLYYMRQDKASELEWLKTLLKKNKIELNSFSTSKESLISLRRNLLIEERTGKKVQPKEPDSIPQQPTPQQTDTLLQQDTSAASTVQQDTLATTIVEKQDSAKKFEPKLKLVEEVAAKTENLKGEVNALVSTTDLMLILLVLNFLVSTWARVRFPQFMRQMFLSILTYSESYKVYRENNRMARQFYWALGGVFSINLSLFLMQNISFFKLPTFGFDGIGLFLLLFLLVLTIYFIKLLVLRTIGQLFMAYRVAEEYWFSVSTINRVLGIVLFPFLIAIPYVPEFLQEYAIQTTWGVVAISFVFRIIRGMRVAIEKHLSVFYMILYFCTLEILPIVLVIKFLMDQVS